MKRKLPEIIKLLNPNQHIIINMVSKDKDEKIFEGRVSDIPLSLLNHNRRK